MFWRFCLVVMVMYLVLYEFRDMIKLSQRLFRLE